MEFARNPAGKLGRIFFTDENKWKRENCMHKKAMRKCQISTKPKYEIAGKAQFISTVSPILFVRSFHSILFLHCGESFCLTLLKIEISM